MSENLDALAQQVTGNSSLAGCSIDELQAVVQRFPYFAPAQFLLAKKLKSAGDGEEAGAQHRKALLYYHDPLLFEQFINAEAFLTAEDGLLAIPDSSPAEVPAADLVPSDLAVAHKPEREVVEEQSAAVAAVTDVTVAPADPPQETVVVNEPVPMEPVAVQNGAVPTVENAQTVSPETAESESKRPVGKSTVPDGLAFEPLYTVDYFASQGIKPPADEAPKDKLGQQLRSFTEWLKTMKRLPVAQLESAVETTAEKKVESLASHSVSDSDVVTEAMAEVWAKQGNRAKAIDIYHKLSLHVPSKKAYFAAKIEHLKQS